MLTRCSSKAKIPVFSSRIRSNHLSQFKNEAAPLGKGAAFVVCEEYYISGLNNCALRFDVPRTRICLIVIGFHALFTERTLAKSATFAPRLDSLPPGVLI
jgi:hypothetical protein